MGEEYSTASRGTLKLKGVHDGKVTKPKRKKKRPKGEGDRGLAADGEGETAVVRAEVEAEAKDPVDEGDRAAIETRDPEPGDSRDAAEFTPRGDEGPNGDAPASVGKTEAQLRHEARRRRMLEDRLKREGTKTHKERVEELNRYLSGLSEHHDMPRIGPG